MRSLTTLGCGLAFLVLLTAGCSHPATNTVNDADRQVRKAFTAFQDALIDRDADKLWELLDRDSQADAGRAATKMREAYAKASAKEKTQQEKNSGLTSAELPKLTGKTFLKTKRFHGKYAEVTTSTITKVKVEGDKATVFYREADGDNATFDLARQDGRWKLSVAMP